MSRVFKFSNGVYPVRKGSVIEFPDPDHTHVMVHHFEKGLTVLVVEGESEPDLYFQPDCFSDCTFIK